MSREQFQLAFRLANGRAIDRDPTPLNDGTFDGFGLAGFRPVTCTIAQVASLISWQARQFDGGWDAAALTEIYPTAKRAFLIVG